MVDRRLRFPHAFVGHRYIAAGVGGVAAAGGFGGAGSETPGIGVVFGGPGGFGGPAGVGAVGAVIAAQPSPPAPILVIPSISDNSLIIAPQPAPLELRPAVAPGPQPTPPPAPPLTISGNTGQSGGSPYGVSIRTAGQRGGGNGSIVLRGQGGRPPATPPPVTPPGPQQGIIHVDTTSDCLSCGSLRAQRDELKKSITVEQQQELQQKIDQQQQQIRDIETREASGQQFTQQQLDQQIQDKIALLQQIEDELAQQGSPAPGTVPQVTQGPAQHCPPGYRACIGEAECAGTEGCVPITPLPSFRQFVQTITHEAECALLLSKFGIPYPVAFTICTAAHELVGDTKALERYAQKVYNELTSQRPTVPALPPPPPPPPAPKPVEFCITCESSEDALKFQAGEGSAKCYLVEGSYRSA